MAEVLVRMRDEEKALLPPGEFLPILEELGMMPQLDRWVVRHVVQRLKRGSRMPRFTVTVSGQTLADAHFPAFVVDEMRASGVEPRSLLFELDEADLAAALDIAARFAAAVQLAGCDVILDSFGSTAHSFDHLKHLRVDFVKVDGSIVRKLLTSAAARGKVDAILRIALAVDIRVIGACVEE